MGILDTLAANKSSNKRTATAAEDRPQAAIWMNVGYEANGKFINLPLGLPIDTMEAVQVRGQDEDWVGVQTARNELLAEIQSLADNLEPGQELTLPLEIRIRRVNGKLELDASSNPYSMSNSGLKLIK